MENPENDAPALNVVDRRRTRSKDGTPPSPMQEAVDALTQVAYWINTPDWHGIIGTLDQALTTAGMEPEECAQLRQMRRVAVSARKMKVDLTRIRDTKPKVRAPKVVPIRPEAEDGAA